MPKTATNMLKVILSGLNQLNKRFDHQENQLNKMFGQQEKQFNQRFDKQEHIFDQWKSQIHDLIDAGFSTKAKKLDEEVDILNVRTVNLRQRTEKLEVTVFGKTT